MLNEYFFFQFKFFIKCIDAKTLISKYKSSENDIWNTELTSQISSDIVSSLYNDAPIGCDYPYSSWFIDQLYDSYATNNQFTINGRFSFHIVNKLYVKNIFFLNKDLVRLMDDLGIPISQPEVSSNKRKKRSIGTKKMNKKKSGQQRSFVSDAEKAKYEKVIKNLCIKNMNSNFN